MTYLDHAAATPLRPAARAAWLAAAELTGNPSSLHRAGRAARRVVEESRESIGAALRVPPSTVVFTAGGTEANNLGVIGTFRARRAADGRRRVAVVSAVEHTAVLAAADALAAEGAEIVSLPVNDTGAVEPEAVGELLAGRGPELALVAVMAVNNEVGTIQPIPELAALCAAAGVPLHCDAVQAVGAVPVDLSLPATVAVSGHKVGGPAGVGALIVSQDATIAPLLFGGGHESGLRAGTLDTPGITGMAAAVTGAVADQRQHADRIGRLRTQLLAGIGAAVPDAVVNSPADGHPGIVNVTFPGCEGDSLMLLLDAAGVCVSTGSACTVGIPQASHVLRAMGAGEREARGALRFSFGWTSAADDVSAVLSCLPDVVARARRAGLVAAGSR